MENSSATRWLDSRVRLATATICTPSCFAKPGICKALVLPPAPIRPTRIFFSDMKRLTFLWCLLIDCRPPEHEASRLSQLLQCALEQLQPVLAPEDLT